MLIQKFFEYSLDLFLDSLILNKYSDLMVDPKDSKELSAEDLAKMTGGYGGSACPHVAGDKMSRNPKIIDEGKKIRIRKNGEEGGRVSGDFVN